MSTVKLPLGLTENGIVNTPSVLTVPATGSSVTLLDGRYRYGSALVQNVGSENMYVLVGGTATATVYHLKLSPMSQADFSDVSYTTVTACADSGKTSNAVVFSVQTNDSVSQGATSY
tara:strand:+ start:3390 stop:3740 length:351 start_codon:yes stop_codon:yes gene_type:complete